MERSTNSKHFSAVCSWCVPAISLLGYTLERGAWTSGKMAVHSTALWLQEHLELADHTQYFSRQVFFSLRQFFCLFSAFLGQDHLKVFAGVTGNSLSQVLRKMWKRPTQQGLEHIIPHNLLFPSLLPAVTLGLAQNQSILSVLRNVLQMSLGDLLPACPLESPTFWDTMSL